MAATDKEAESVAVVLVGGGARSGKSRFALERARREAAFLDNPRLMFIATAEARDDEMRERIEKHRAERGDEFVTVEEPVELARAIRESCADATVVDCLTLWLSNILNRDIDAATQELEAAARGAKGCVIFITNEVGCSIVPENAMARRFRDQAGILNQRMASIATEVYWMVFGQPLRIK